MTPTGDERLAQAAMAREQRQASNKPALFMSKNNTGPYVVRFLEQGPDKRIYVVHTYKTPHPNNPTQTITKYFTCLNDKEDGTQCPGCEAGMNTTMKGAYNVIQRDRPQIRRGADKKPIKDGQGKYIVDGQADEVVVWVCAGTTADIIRQKDGDYKGLMSRDVKLLFTGASFQPYSIEVADIDAGAVPMSEADLKLAESKHNLDEYMAPPGFQDAARIAAAAMAGGAVQESAPSQSAPAASSEPTPEAANPFLNTAQG